MSRSLTAWTMLLVLLAMPATALAQSAGDDQYSDPLAEEQPSTQGQQPQSGDQSGSTPQPSSPAPTQSAPEPAQSDSTADGATNGADTLPRTGLDVVLLLAAAAPLLLGGFALRRVTRDV